MKNYIMQSDAIMNLMNNTAIKLFNLLSKRRNNKCSSDFVGAWKNQVKKLDKEFSCNEGSVTV